jgi:PleD family two-component response regulator
MIEFFPPFEETSRMIQWVKQKSPETYIIMVTDTLINDPTYEKLFEIGLDALFFKPFSARKILAHIRKGLRQKDLILTKKELETQPIDSVSQFVQQLIFSPIYFKKCFRQELKCARRHQRPFSLLIIRIPSKEDMGDQSFYLELGNIFRKNVREEDTVGWEKGNFGIILPETDEAGSQTALKRLLNLIKTHPLLNSNEILRTMVQTLDFESLTYPEKFQVPEFLKAMVDDLEK